MNNEPMQEEMTIDLLDFLGKFLSKWKQVVACMLVCAVAVLAGGYLKDSAAAKAAAATAVTATPETLEKYTPASMTKDEWDTLVRTALCYQAVIDAENAYLSNSVLMNLPQNTETDYTMQYRIDGALTNSQKQLLSDAYSAALKSDALYEKIAQTLAPEYTVEPAYIGELISVGNNQTTGQENSAQTNIVLDSENTSAEGAAMLYQVTVVGPDETFCKTVGAVVEATILDEMSQVSQLAPHTIALSSSRTSTAAVIKRLTDKRDCYTVIKTTKADLDTLEKNLAEDEKTMLSQALLQEKAGDAAQLAPQETPAAVAAPAVKPSAKNAAIGALLGLVLAGGWFALTYLMSSKVHTATELEERFGQVLLGTIGTSKTEKKMTNALDKMPWAGNRPLPKGTSLELIRQMIVSRAQAAKAETVGISCLATGEEAHALCAELAAELSRDGLRAVTMESVVSSSEALRAAAEVDALVFVEAPENTEANELKENLKYCGTKNQPILGAVVLQ